MPVVLPRYPCPVCGQAHDLCHAGPRAYSVSGTYAFTCPTTQQPVTFRPFLPGTYVCTPPADAVALRRVDSNP